MQVSVEQTSAIGRQITVQIPAEVLQSEVEKRIAKGMQDELRSRRVDGFRAGKVPKQLIQDRFGGQVDAQARREAIDTMIRTTLPAALEELSLIPAGRPQVDSIRGADVVGQDLCYVVSLEIFPVFSLPPFSSLNVQQFVSEVTEADVDHTLEKLQSQLATWESVQRPAKVGDRLSIRYSSTLNGKAYEHSHQQDVLVELGSGLFIEGFEQGLEGASVGETHVLSLRFPTDWRDRKLADQAVEFTVDVQVIDQKNPALLDEHFAKKIGVAQSDPSLIRQKIRLNLEQQCVAVQMDKTRQQVLDQLVAACDILLPQALVQDEIAAMHEELHRRAGDKAAHSCQHQGLEEEAKKRVKLSLIFREIVKLNSLSPDEAKVKEKIEKIATAYGNAEFVESMYHESNELLQGIRNSVLVDQAIDLIMHQASKSSKPVSVEELLTAGV